MRCVLIYVAAGFAVAAILSASFVSPAGAQVPTTLDDFFLPGSQPGDSGNIEHPGKCDNCHGGYDTFVEPAFNWRGSMMAQAARDPLFFACMAISNQDAPDVGDLCLRCHTPDGWLAGRSVPTDGSALNNNDREGVQCDFCHKLVDPLAVAPNNPYPDDPDYTADSLPEDQEYLGYLSAFGTVPPTSGNGMYVVDSANAKRGPFVDAAARHQMIYSPFHRDAALCGTCHDVSNPVYDRTSGDQYVPNAFGAPATSFEPYDQFPVERTYSEWLMSDFNSAGGATCQDCHMPDVVGYGCNKKGTPLRSDLPLHDFTGGNTFIPPLVYQLYPDEVDPNALAAGVMRARSMLQIAATMDLTVTQNSAGTFKAVVRVTNNTGHKLPSGYPEGRRIWINLQAFADQAKTVLLWESGAYDFDTAILNTAGAKVYEIKPGIGAGLAPIVDLPEGPSFHFVLNNEIFSDNRIPPLGFTNAAFEAIQSPPVNYTYADGQNWDETVYDGLPAETVSVRATLYYQTTSKEYVEFLRDENHTNDWGDVFYQLWANAGKSTPEVMETAAWSSGGTVDEEPPTSPAGLTAAASGNSAIDLNWTASTDNVAVVGYDVYRDDAYLTSVAGTSYSDSGLEPSTTYSYYVTAYDEAGNGSGPSNTASATTKKKGGGKPRK